MRADQFIRKILLTSYVDLGHTVDRIVAGRADKDVHRVATAMFITPDVLRAAAEWGADLIMTHEPTFHTDAEDAPDFAPYAFKRELLRRHDITVCRWHDSPHYGDTDYVSAALVRRMDWKGTFDGTFTFVFDEPVTPLKIARDIRDRLHIAQPRLVGRRDGAVKKVTIQLGQRGSEPFLKMLDSDIDLALCGELCEWHAAEPIRDMAQLGMQKTILILGHAGSERDVMEDLANYIDRTFSDDGISARYFDCGELYTYLDD